MANMTQDMRFRLSLIRYAGNAAMTAPGIPCGMVPESLTTILISIPLMRSLLLRKQGMAAVNVPNPKYVPNPYEPMDYPGQRDLTLFEARLKHHGIRHKLIYTPRYNGKAERSKCLTNLQLFPPFVYGEPPKNIFRNPATF